MDYSHEARFRSNWNLSGSGGELGEMNAGESVGKVSKAEAQRITKLATTQGGPYLNCLWALVEYALNDEVHASAYARATQTGDRGQP